MNRRQFGWTTVGGLVGAATPAVGVGQPTNLIVVRKNFATLTPAELKAFEDGILAMQTLATDKPADPLGWQNMAEIHNNNCPHGNWFFLPWHRAYLYYFELVCRKLTGNAQFAIPYWDWSKDRKVPAPFLNPKSPLYHQHRIVQNLGQLLDDARVGPAAVGRIVGRTDFVTFAGGGSNGRAKDLRNDPESGGAGELEDGPHNDVHEHVGRDPSGKNHKTMFTQRAPLDPLFLVHHANVDRLWTRWCYVPPPKGRKKEWPPETYWKDQKLTFVGVGAVGSTKQVKECLSTFDLSYTYDEFLDPGDPQKRPALVVSFPLTKETPEPAATSEGGKSHLDAMKPFAEVKLGLTDVFGMKLATHLPGFDSPRKAVSFADVRLRITFAKLPPEGGGVRVFVNNPEANDKTPTTDKSYTGHVTFFPLAHAHGEMGHVSYVTLGPVLQRTKFVPRPGNDLRVTFVATPRAEGGGVAPVIITEVRAEIVEHE